MKMQRLLLVALLLVFLWLSAVPLWAQDQEIHFSALPSEKVKASDITWQHHFGYRKEEPNNVYILMTQGGFLAPTSKNFESLIKSWLAKHPKANAIVVYTLEGMMEAIPDSKMKAVWIVDGNDNLNIHLVRMGGCPAGTMFMNRRDKTALTREEYESFVMKVIEAEDLAKKEKLGIWSESKD
jgi:hypothetical protein